jgi:hypothetical protein
LAPVVAEQPGRYPAIIEPLAVVAVVADIEY